MICSFVRPAENEPNFCFRASSSDVDGCAAFPASFERMLPAAALVSSALRFAAKSAPLPAEPSPPAFIQSADRLTEPDDAADDGAAVLLPESFARMLSAADEDMVRFCLGRNQRVFELR